MADDLDRLFAALANRYRREMVDLLGLQPYSISRLADLNGLSLPAMNKHVRRRDPDRKLGRTTFLTLDRSAIRVVQAWLATFHAYWGTEKETLENYERFLKSQPTATREDP